MAVNTASTRTVCCNLAFDDRIHERVLMLPRRIRRWPNIKTTLGHRPVLAGMTLTLRLPGRSACQDPDILV